MAREYIDELGDGTINPETTGVDSQATDNGTHVKTLAPIYYTPATIANDGKATRETPVTIKSALEGKSNKNDGVYYVVGTYDYPNYSASSTYTATTSSGPFTSANSCVYGGKAYFCKTAISTPEAWNSGHWTAIPTPVLTGTIDGVTELYAGLKIAYKFSITGGSSSTYLNINNLGNKYIRRNDGNLTTHIPYNSAAFLVFDGTYWRWADYDSDNIYAIHAACSTAAATQSKTATAVGYVLTAGETFLIRFSNANTYAGKLTLNVNSQGAKDIWINGSVSSASNYNIPAGIWWCHYDGTVYHIWTDGSVLFKELRLTTKLADDYIASATTWNAKQDALATQTAYSAKGTATKVPQITTNSLGQVTGITEVTISGVTPASHTHGNIANGGTLTDTAAAAAGNDYVVIRDADNAKIQTSTIKGTDVADAVSKKHSHSTLTLSTTAQAYDGSHTLALPSTDPYTSARTPASHASTATTYGIGTTSNYGHVKLATGDMNGATNTDGVAVSKNHTHSQYAPKASPALTGTPTAPTAADGTNTTQIATTAFVQSAVAQGLSVSDAMVYKGTITLGATSPGGLTVAADKGHTYKVVANGTTKEGYVDGVKVEAGDMVICNTDSTAAATSSNYSTIATKWDYVQGNTDGVVVGPSSAVSGNVVLFEGATGKLVKDGGTLGTAAFKSVTDTYSSTGTDPVSGKAVAAAINALDVTEVGGDGKYIKKIKEDNGKITATVETMDTTPTANSTKAVTSGGIKTALDGKAASDHTHYRLVETDSTTLLPNNAGGNNYKLYKSSFTDFCWCMFLYEITEFFDGTIVNAGSENSTFFGDVSILRLVGYPDIKNAKVGAMISYNTSTVLSSDSEKIMPIIAKQDVTYIHTWCTATNQCIAIGDVGSNVAIDTPTTLSTSRYTIIECENYTSLYVNAGWYSVTWSSVKTTVGAVWAFIDANNKVISRSAATAYGSNEILTVPSNAKKFICNCSGLYAAYAYVGIPAETSRYFLALDIRAGAGTATLFGRFYTRATATSSYSARPLLLTSISNIGINSQSVPPVGWTEYRRGTHQTEAGTADKLTTARKLAVSLSNTSTDTSFDGSADVTNIKVSGQLADANIASAATWNAKQNALTINDSKPITIGTAAASNTVAGQAHTHDGITSVARASVTNIDLPNSGTEPARMTLSQVTNATTQGTDPGDGYVLNLLWDNAGNWDTQIYVPNAKKVDKDFGHLKVRYKNESSTWGDWEYLPGAFMGTLLTSTDDLDAIPAPQKGTSGEVIQYYWKYTSKPKSTSSIGQTGMDATTGLPSGTGSANLFVFEQSNNRTDARHLIQLMVCADIGIWVRRQFSDVWSVWSKVLTSSDITTNTSTKNGIITVAGTDKNVYVHPTSSGNKHIPSGGSSGQVLGYSSDGTAVWKDITNSMVPVGSKYDLIFNNETDRTPIKVFEVTGTCSGDTAAHTAEIIVYRRGSTGSMDNVESYRVVAAWKRRERNDAPAAIVKVVGTSLEGTWTGVVTNTVVPPVDGQGNTTFSLYYTPTVNYRMYYMHLVSCGSRGNFTPCAGNITLSTSVREAIPTPTYDRSTVTTSTGNPVMLGETQVITSTNSPSRDPFDSSTLLFPTERGVANMLSKYDAKFIRANNTADASNCWVKLASKTLDIRNSVVSSGLWEVIIEDTYIQYSVLSFHTFINASTTESSFSQNELIWTGNREAPASRGFNFCVTLTKKTAEGEPTIIELWCQCTQSQRGVGIREIGGNAWNPDRWDTHKWTYYNPADSEKTTKPVGTETMTVLDPIPENFTHSVSKGINLPGNSVSYLRIAMPEFGTTHLFFGYNYHSENLHGEYIIRQHSNGGNASQCQILNLTSGTNPQAVEFRRSGPYCYVKFDRTGESGTVNYRFGTTDLSGMRACDFELVSELPSSTILITPTGPSARKLDTARELSVDLSSTSTTATSFDGTQNVSIKNTGTLPISKGGTGKTSVTAGNYLVGNGTNALAEKTPNVAANDLINALPVGDSTPGGDDYYVSQYANGGTTTTTYYRRPIKLLWEYIKTRISSVLGLTATNYGGTAATATTSADASNELQVVGVQSSATSTLKRDSGVTVQGGAVKATTFKLGTNATITYNSTTEAIDFTFL